MKLLPLIPIWVAIVFAVLIGALFIYCIVTKKYRKLDYFRRIGILILVLFIALRPVIRGGEGESQLSNLNIYFAVDATNSMVAKDCDNGETRRFEKVRNDIKTIAHQFPGAQYSIIMQDIATYIAMPLSTNADTLVSYANALTPKYEGLSQGTSISNLLNLVDETVSNYSKEYPDRKNILFLFSDGEVTNTSSSSATTNLKRNIASGYVFGYGTKNGAPLEQIQSWTGKILEGYYIRESGSSSSSYHYSRIDEGTLKSLASAIGVDYANRTLGDMPSDLADELSKDEELTSSSSAESYTETYWIIALLLIAVIIWDFYAVFNRLLLERREK